MNLDLRYYLAIFWRRLPLFLLVAVPVIAASLALAVLLPAKYVANASLLVQSAQVPENLAQSTVQVGEREQVQLLERRLLTRSALLEIARDYGVYSDLDLLSPDQIVSRMREDTTIRPSGGGRDAAVIVDVRFTAESANIAAAVTNEYVTRMLDLNARARREMAEDTLVFFEEEVQRLETELDLKNQAIVEFQNENADALPDTLQTRMERQSTLLERLSSISRDLLQLQEERNELQDLLDGDPARLSAASDTPLTPTEQQLVSLRNELTTARSVYSETSPRVVTLEARVAALESALSDESDAAEGSQPDDGDSASNPRRMEVMSAIARLQTEIEFLQGEKLQLEREVDRLEETIRQTPNNAIALQSLEREYDNTQRQHARAVDALSQAVTGERLELSSKAQRISVLEQAVPPNEPDSPDRRVIAAGGVVAGFGAGFGLVALLELLNRSIRRPADLTNGLGIVPLVTVPYIATPGERLRRRVVLVGTLLLLVVAIPAGLWYVHYQVMPLDLLLDRVVTELIP